MSPELAIVAGGGVLATTLAFIGFRSKPIRYARNPHPPLRYMPRERVQGWDMHKACMRYGVVAVASGDHDGYEKYRVRWDGESAVDPMWHDVASLYLEGTVQE